MGLTGEPNFAAYAGAVAAILVALAGLLFKLLGDVVTKQIKVATVELIQQIDDKDDEMAKHFGETVQAVKQKLTDVELWNRDNFVNLRTFDSFNNEARDFWRRFEDKIDRRLDLIDRKLAKLNGENRE